MKTKITIMMIGIMATAYQPMIAADTKPGLRAIDLNGEAFENLRDPFWPVEHERISESEKVEETKIANLKAKIQWPRLPLRGITHAGGKRYLAIIEGIGIVEAGDIVTKQQDSLIYRWMIDKVTAAGITSTRLDVTETVQN